MGTKRIQKHTIEHDDLYARAFELRTERQMTIAQIAEAIGITKYQVRTLLSAETGRLPRAHRYKPVYPYLEAWALKNYASISECARALGISNTSLEQIIYWGGPWTRKEIIDRILSLSGLTYETAFREART